MRDGGCRRVILHPSFVFAWAAGEATIWPIMPDAGLVPLAALRPRDWWRLALAATAGSLMGGLLSYGLGRRVPPEPLLARLPLVRPPMVAQARRWLATEGALGLRHQPLSGLPYKVFALLAGSIGIPPGPFLAASLAARGARFLVVSGLAAALGLRFAPLVRRHRGPLLVAWSAAFLLGLRRMVTAWERRDGEV
jgi:membrane protein YqaA with SNARE-associated domain